MSRRDEILNNVAREEARIADLQGEVARTTARLRALLDELATLPNEAPLPPAPDGGPAAQPDSFTTAEKIAIFRSLFRGRADVFARRWENPRTRRSGYAPACGNEWVEGVCLKKEGGRKRGAAVCGACPHQAFLPVTDREILQHLQGRQILGVYPLLPDDTSWFLAVDLDAGAWQADTTALVETCRAHGVPAAVERTRSGAGAHVWIFFTAPIPAVTARQLGCFLLTETMTRRHELSMASYDRLFPNQDSLPKGGFGNLIALPLQHQARGQGNTVFVDDAFVPFPDQWGFLARLRKISPAEVQRLADAASRQGQVLGVRVSILDDEEGTTPWGRHDQGQLRVAPIPEPLPSQVRAVLSQRLFIEKAGLPPQLLNRLKRLAAFQNPEFYKRQSLRLSTARTPRVISCAEDLPHHITLPRGCRSDAETLLRDNGVSLAVEDQREDGEPLAVHFQGTLTPIQTQAVDALLTHETGVLVAPPGAGKSVAGIALVARRGRTTLILVHRRPLLDQWLAQLALFLGIDAAAVGQIGAGRSKPTGRLDVAMIQSLVRKGTVDPRVADYGHIIVDECHHIPAVSFERVLSEAKARFVLGLTATPQRRDGHHPITQMQLGPVRFAVDPKGEAAHRPFEHRLIVRDTGFQGQDMEGRESIQHLYTTLAADARRNQLIFDDMLQALEQGRSPILLTERRDHLDHFAERLAKFTRHLVVLHGGMTARARRDAVAQLAAIPGDEERLLLATGRYAGEGFDDARLDTLFLALPISWKGTLVQYTGRLHRLHPGKREVQIYDYVDRGVPTLRRMFEKRLRGYRAMGYILNEASQGVRGHGCTSEERLYEIEERGAAPESSEKWER